MLTQIEGQVVRGGHKFPWLLNGPSLWALSGPYVFVSLVVLRMNLNQLPFEVLLAKRVLHAPDPITVLTDNQLDEIEGVDPREDMMGRMTDIDTIVHASEIMSELDDAGGDTGARGSGDVMPEPKAKPVPRVRAHGKAGPKPKPAAKPKGKGKAKAKARALADTDEDDIFGSLGSGPSSDAVESD